MAESLISPSVGQMVTETETETESFVRQMSKKKMVEECSQEKDIL